MIAVGVSKRFITIISAIATLPELEIGIQVMKVCTVNNTTKQFTKKQKSGISYFDKI